MKLSPGEQESIISLLTRIYLDIAQIETEFNLMAGKGDFRPRIEYFHDAVRAHSSQDPLHTAPDGRLSVELLAYDLSCLRYICDMPLSPFKPHAEPLSANTGLVALNNTPTVQSKRPDRAVKERISDLYQHYAVLFAALLKPQADRDYHDRTDHLNQDVGDINTLIQQLESFTQGKQGIEPAAATIQHLEDAGPRQLLTAFLQQQKFKNKGDINKLKQYLKEETRKKDKAIAVVEKAHMEYALSQLAIYENSKDMLKKMAMQGTNLVGNFVEASVAETRREMGR